MPPEKSSSREIRRSRFWSHPRSERSERKGVVFFLDPIPKTPGNASSQNFSPPPSPKFPRYFPPFPCNPAFPPHPTFPHSKWLVSKISPFPPSTKRLRFFFPEIDSLTGWWFQRFVSFHPPTWKNDPIWLSIFQIGWFNHQLVNSSSTKYSIYFFLPQDFSHSLVPWWFFFEACPTQLTRITQRPWGVSDLKFFTDDDCFEPIDGGAGGRVFVGFMVNGEWWDLNFGALFFTVHVFCLVGREKPGVVLSEEEMWGCWDDKFLA